MKEEYTKKDLRKYLTSALKELGAYDRFAISFEILCFKLLISSVLLSFENKKDLNLFLFIFLKKFRINKSPKII